MNDMLDIATTSLLLGIANNTFLPLPPHRLLRQEIQT